MWQRTRCALVPALLAVLAGCSTTADFHNMDGVRLYQQGNHQTALQRFQQAVAANPQNPDAYYNLASTLHQLGTKPKNPALLTQAETVYNQCLDLNENHVECRRGLAVLLVETDRPEKAEKLLTNWVTQRPDLADAYVELARLYEEFGDTDRAFQQLSRAVMVDHRNARAWAALGSIREKAGDKDQALANYRRSLELNPMQPAVGARVASLYGPATPNINIALPPTPGTRTVTAPSLPAPPRY